MFRNKIEFNVSCKCRDIQIPIFRFHRNPLGFQLTLWKVIIFLS